MSEKYMKVENKTVGRLIAKAQSVLHGLRLLPKVQEQSQPEGLLRILSRNLSIRFPVLTHRYRALFREMQL